MHRGTAALSVRRWVLALLAAAAIAGLAGCTVYSDSAFLIHDAVGATEDNAAFRDDLRELSDEGWHLYLYLLPADAAIENPASLGVDIERPGAKEVADGTLVLLSAASVPPRFVIRGPGGDELQGRAASVAAEVAALMPKLQSVPESTIASSFIFAVSEAVDVNLVDADAPREERSWQDRLLTIVAVLTVILGTLRIGRLLWKYRHDTGKVTPIGSLQPGMKALVEGQLLCENPIHVADVDLWAAYTRTTSQYMGKEYSSKTEDDFDGFTYVRTTTDITRETGWKDGYSRTEGAWFQVDDGTDQVWVSGAGAKIDGEFMAASERRGDKRKTLHAVLTNAQVAVQGLVHRDDEGLLVIGGPKGKLKKGFFISILPAKAIARRGKRTAKSAAIQAAILFAACMVGIAIF